MIRSLIGPHQAHVEAGPSRAGLYPRGPRARVDAVRQPE